MKEIGQHKNMVSMLGCVTKQSPQCLIFEFIPHKDLLRCLREKRFKVIKSHPQGKEHVFLSFGVLYLAFES